MYAPSCIIFFQGWGLYTLLHLLPSYLKSVLNFDIKQVSMQLFNYGKSFQNMHFLYLTYFVILNHRTVGYLHFLTFSCGLHPSSWYVKDSFNASKKLCTIIEHNFFYETQFLLDPDC